MPRWAYTVDVSDVFRADIPFVEKRNSIVARLRASRWVRELGDDSELGELVDDLAAAADVRDFDLTWADIYDQADEDRCWIATR